MLKIYYYYRIILKLGDLVSQWFGTDCTCALDLSQLDCFADFACKHVNLVFDSVSVTCMLALSFVDRFCTHFTSGAFLLNSFSLQLTSLQLIPV